MTRTLIIGLDGATWDVIKPLAEEGRLPTLKKLMEEGVWGDLESTANYQFLSDDGNKKVGIEWI